MEQLKRNINGKIFYCEHITKTKNEVLLLAEKYKKTCFVNYRIFKTKNEFQLFINW